MIEEALPELCHAACVPVTHQLFTMLDLRAVACRCFQHSIDVMGHIRSEVDDFGWDDMAAEFRRLAGEADE
jgi:hypothetical protein